MPGTYFPPIVQRGGMRAGLTLNSSYKKGISENISRRKSNVLNATYRTNPPSLYNFSGF
jgi:hypothetical protein